MKKELVAAVACLVIATPAMGDCRSKDGMYNPNNKGTKSIVWGIVMGASAIPAGLATGFVLGTLSASCDDEKYSESECERRENRAANRAAAAAILTTGAGLAGGYFIFRRGKDMRNQWYEWEEQCEREEGYSQRPSFRFDGFSLSNGGGGVPALAATFSF